MYVYPMMMMILRYGFQVLKFIKKKGRISLTELAAESNKLINLDARKKEEEDKPQSSEEKG